MTSHFAPSIIGAPELIPEKTIETTFPITGDGGLKVTEDIWKEGWVWVQTVNEEGVNFWSLGIWTGDEIIEFKNKAIKEIMFQISKEFFKGEWDVNKHDRSLTEKLKSLNNSEYLANYKTYLI